MAKLNKKIPLIINCDPGIDDAVALMLVIKSDIFDVKLITTDLGNAGPKQSAQNCNNIYELLGGENVKVCAGDGKGLKRDRAHVSVHGKTGMGSYIFEPHSRKVSGEDAIEAMYEAIMDSDEKVTILCMSPTSNLAKLQLKHKDCWNSDKIEKVVIMAGSIEELKDGEIPYAEFNISCDPESAEMLFPKKPKVPVVVVPMEMGHTAYLDWQDVFKTKNMNSVGAVFEYMFRNYKDRHVKNGIATHDGCAVAYMIDPKIFKTEKMFAEVRYFKEIDSGVLLFKKGEQLDGVEPNVLACTQVDVKRFKKLYFKYLKKCK